MFFDWRKIYFLHKKNLMGMIKYKYILIEYKYIFMEWQHAYFIKIFFSLNVNRFGLNIKIFNKQK